jgi:hypothetical protein
MKKITAVMTAVIFFMKGVGELAELPVACLQLPNLPNLPIIARIQAILLPVIFLTTENIHCKKNCFF